MRQPVERSMNVVKNFSLKNKILMVVLPIIVLSLSIVAYAIYFEIGDYVLRNMLGATSEISASLSNWLTEGTVQLEQKVAYLYEKPRDPENQMSVILGDYNQDDFLRRYPNGYAGIMVYMSGIGEEYVLEKGSIRMIGRVDARALDFYHSVVIGNRSIQVALSGYTNASGKRGICILSTVKDEQGKPYGILGYHIFPETVMNKIEETQLPDGSKAILLDRDGTAFLFKSDGSAEERREIEKGKQLADKDGIYRYLWNSRPQLVFYQKITATDWTLAVSIDEVQLMTKAKALLVPILVVVFGVLIISILAFLAIVRLITRPISILENAISQVSKADFTLRRVDIDSTDELGRLARSFENMVANLRLAREERNRAFEKLRLSEDKYAKAFNASSEMVAITTVKDGRYVEVNEAIHTIFGYTREEAIGHTSLELGIRRDENERSQYADLVKTQGKIRNLEVVHYTKFGEKRIGLLSAELIEFYGEACMIATFRDITELKEAEKELRYMGSHDALTGLYNRTFFEQEMNLLRGWNVYPVAFIICDVDGLKLMNDTMGHVAGDQLLKTAAYVLKQAIREEYVAARIGGDEFAILLAGVSEKQVEAVCGTIRQEIDRYNQGERNLYLSISIGYALSDKRGPADVIALFKKADNNMYKEKLQRSRSAHNAIVLTAMRLLETRDFIKEGHGERMQNLAIALAKECGIGGRSVTEIRRLAQFHDIGKVGISEHILLKAGSLTLQEKEEMKRHSEIGHRIALSSPSLLPIADWILKHHEWWDGSGYPLGLKEEDIPLECRILAIVDAYDAMTNDRPYRKAMTKRAALEELKRWAGTQFDPELVLKFTALVQKKELC